MKRSELVEKLSADGTLTQREARLAVDAFFDAITEALAERRRVELRGFGVFEPRKRGARMGRNPKNGDAVAVEEKVVPMYKAGRKLLRRLNPGSEKSDPSA